MVPRKKQVRSSRLRIRKVVSTVGLKKARTQSGSRAANRSSLLPNTPGMHSRAEESKILALVKNKYIAKICVKTKTTTTHNLFLKRWFLREPCWLLQEKVLLRVISCRMAKAILQLNTIASSKLSDINTVARAVTSMCLIHAVV